MQSVVQRERHHDGETGRVKGVGGGETEDTSLSSLDMMLSRKLCLLRFMWSP